MNKPLHIVALADLHYYSRTLGDSERAYRLRCQSDQRCLAESGAIVDSAFSEIANDETIDAVIIAGDLTNDGEICSHEEIREKLYKLQEKKPVYVITSTHDWCCDGWARRYVGNHAFYDVPTMAENDLPEFYGDFGIKNALSIYKSPLGGVSYCAQIAPGYRLLGLNDDHNGEGKAGFTEEHMSWIKQQISDANDANETIIAMEHHLVLPHISPLVNNGQSVGNKEKTAENFADSGLELLFTGHSHMQHISEYKSDKGNSLYEINVGALTGYPAPMMHCIIDENEIKLEMKPLEKFTFDGEEIEAQPYLKQHLTEMITRLTVPGAHGDALEFLDRAAALGFKMKRRYFYFPVFPAVYIYSKLKVGSTAAVLNALTFGKAVNRKAAKAIRETNISDIVLDLFVNLFDNAEVVKEDSPLYRVVTDAVSLPRRVLKHIPKNTEKIQRTLTQVEDLVKEMMCPSEPNNHKFVIKRK